MPMLCICRTQFTVLFRVFPCFQEREAFHCDNLTCLSVKPCMPPHFNLYCITPSNNFLNQKLRHVIMMIDWRACVIIPLSWCLGRRGQGWVCLASSVYWASCVASGDQPPPSVSGVITSGEPTPTGLQPQYSSSFKCHYNL